MYVVTAVAVAMSAFHLWVAFVGPPEAYVMRGTHLAFALVLAFLVMPGLNGRAERPGWFGWALVLAAAQFEQLGRREEAADLRELL